MSKYTDKVRAEFSSGYWAFMDPAEPGHRVRFDQALIDATWVGPGQVEGYVKAVHGVDIEQVWAMNSRQKLALGITSNHRFGLESHQRLRLNPDGTIEKMGVQ